MEERTRSKGFVSLQSLQVLIVPCPHLPFRMQIERGMMDSRYEVMQLIIEARDEHTPTSFVLRPIVRCAACRPPQQPRRSRLVRSGVKRRGAFDSFI